MTTDTNTQAVSPEATALDTTPPAPALVVPAPVIAAAVPAAAPTVERPDFINNVASAYSERGKNVIVLTGNIHDLFWSAKKNGYLELEQVINQEWNAPFSVARLDIAGGVSIYDQSEVEVLQKALTFSDAAIPQGGEKFGSLVTMINKTLFQPLTAIVTLQKMLEGVTSARRLKQELKKELPKPVLTIVQVAGSIFPAGDFDRLNELDRQRLVTFLNLIQSPTFKNSQHMVVLVADTRSEVNQRITSLPNVECIEIDLPQVNERRRYVENLISALPADKKDSIKFEKDANDFIESTAGLTLTSVRQILEPARRTGTTVTRKMVNAAVNAALEAELGDMIKIPLIDWSTKNIDGYEETGKMLEKAIRRCDKTETAIPAILISGPNGGGKTYQMSAYAVDSGRVVIELTGLRSQWFGQTDVLFEKLRLRIRNFNKVLILIDEAHTAFGSVHKSDTHETEKRLAGNIIKMMGDPTLFGHVLWGLMTSRPDELDPDVKSRAPIQIPIFDLTGDERKAFLRKQCKRKSIEIPDEEIDQVMKITELYSNRDFSFLIKEVVGEGNNSVLKTLSIWQASKSILRQRALQSMIAAQHCSYPGLLPKELAELVDKPEFEQEIQQMKQTLGYT